MLPQLTPAQAMPLLRPGGILLTNRAGSWVARAINLFQGLARGRLTIWSHAMRAGEHGMIHSQEATRRALPMERWRGARMRHWWNPAYGASETARLLEESTLRLGTPYDLPGIGGQVLRVLPWVGGWLAQRADAPFLNFCSEGECEIERTVNQGFCGAGGCQVSPADINAWCQAQGWECLTFKLV